MTESPKIVEENISKVAPDVKEKSKIFGLGKKVKNALVFKNTAATSTTSNDLPTHKNLS